jgi:hypothetical protein
VQPRSKQTKKDKKDALIGDTLFPLFCISVHEHAWMSAGYGVWGKEEWLKKFWSVVNWQRVSEQYEYYTGKMVLPDKPKERPIDINADSASQEVPENVESVLETQESIMSNGTDSTTKV